VQKPSGRIVELRVNGRPSSSPAALRVEALTKRFSSRQRETLALDGIDLEVADGEIVSLLGPSGCGKSTLLFTIAGLEEPTTGRVVCYGEPVEKPGRARTVMFQEYALFPWRTVLGNVTIALEGRPEVRDAVGEARAALSLVGLTGFENAYPHQLSGGMKQRTALARCLAMRPRVLLMDEPFAAVDSQTREALQDELLRIWAETRMTVVFVTHSLEEAIYLAQRVVVMTPRPGRLKRIITVDACYPRDYEFRTSALANSLRAEIYSLLHEKV
jgi:NitT/TauT family transport system ATP-binding protein